MGDGSEGCGEDGKDLRFEEILRGSLNCALDLVEVVYI
jgi:hypothetical protein